MPELDNQPSGGTDSKPKDKKLFSLKWKIYLLVSLTLIVIVFLYSLASYVGLMKNLHDRQQVRNQNYARELAALLRSTASDLQQLAEMVPYLGGVESALHNEKMQNISQILEQYWSLMQIQNGIELLRIDDRKNQLVAIKSAIGVRFPEDAVMKQWISNVNASEKPISPVICHETCMQFVIAPLLIRGEKVGVIVMGMSLADVLLRFKQLTGDDIGLLVEKSDSGMRLPGWGSHVSGLTNRQESFELLQQVSLIHQEKDSLFEGIQTRFHERILYIKLFPIPALVGENNANFIVMTDVTRSVGNIHDSIKQIVMVGAAGLLASGLIMWMMFTQLLSRLMDMAYLLPMLAKRNFREFRSALDSYGKTGRFHDEVDKVFEAASALSVQLENLEKKARTRARKLSEQKKVLRRERDFVSHLLNTAQVIVLTQNQRGKILSLNRFGMDLLQYEEEEIISAPFVCFLTDGESDRELNEKLEAMREGKRLQYRHESLTLCKDGSTRNIAWLHSKLDFMEEDEPAILSVGLDVTEYKRVETHLAWLADHDPLTNLFNRRRFSEELQHMIERAERYSHTGALLYFDLDKFKYINDTSGHQAGDELIKIIATMLSRTVRAGDVTGRLGGDEFAVILPEISEHDAIEVAKKILAQLNQTHLSLNSRIHRVTASIGIAMFPQHGNNVHDLLAAADLAMYQAKETGRGAWHLFSDTDQSRERMHTLVYWKENIEYAHLSDNFLLYLQPIVDLKTDETVSYEVLLRMRNQKGEILSPAGFIPAAEHMGLIHAIDHMVLRKVIEILARVQKTTGHRSITFSVNLSAHSFNDPELLSLIEETLALHQVNPEYLVFEITETAALENLPGALNLMKKIQKLGCHFVLDDFGVGFSSFYYLRELPVNAVKLDGSFIRNLSQNPDDRILVNALCSVARGFDKQITAEYVENRTIYDLVRDLDIDYVQGFHVGRPRPYEEFFVLEEDLKSDSEPKSHQA